ncbi:unnamed protein product [Chondrus crispus]|uniref:Uncharacterized protein n=1 Tax=Chondrus crispus TaxID=2769 RepID=R7QK99_CHOCR|nr:unnamed protein product [Chondrus crispus]CDF38193.1 unnamed protein product [Chondrus crispus]|eukprot:XP_005718062.1 unnamed protein product [Chondrus crispus]
MEGGGVGSVLGIVKSGAELEEKERKALWKSPSLVTTTTAVQAQWVALQSICDGCIAGLGAERDKMSTKVIQADEGGTSALKQGPVSVRKGSGLALEAASSEDSHDTGPGALASAASSEGDEGCTLLKHEKGPYSRNAGE